jgi:chemotaxis signal transduction protein
VQVGGGHKVIGLTVDEVVDLLTVDTNTLEPRQALAGVDPILIRAVGRRGDSLFVVLDTDALLAPILS